MRDALRCHLWLSVSDRRRPSVVICTLALVVEYIQLCNNSNDMTQINHVTVTDHESVSHSHYVRLDEWVVTFVVDLVHREPWVGMAWMKINMGEVSERVGRRHCSLTIECCSSLSISSHWHRDTLCLTVSIWIITCQWCHLLELAWEGLWANKYKQCPEWWGDSHLPNAHGFASQGSVSWTLHYIKSSGKERREMGRNDCVTDEYEMTKTNKLNDWLHDWLNDDWLWEWVYEEPNENEWMNEWMSEWLADWLTDCELTKWMAIWYPYKFCILCVYLDTWNRLTKSVRDSAFHVRVPHSALTKWSEVCDHRFCIFLLIVRDDLSHNEWMNESMWMNECMMHANDDWLRVRVTSHWRHQSNIHSLTTSMMMLMDDDEFRWWDRA